MKAAQKKKLAEMIRCLIEKDREQYENEWDVALDVVSKMGLEFSIRNSVKKIRDPGSILKPPPKDMKSKIQIRVMSRSSFRSDEQLWVCLPKETALKALVLGFFPETIQS